MELNTIQYFYIKNVPILDQVFGKVHLGLREQIPWDLVNESFYSSYVFYFGGKEIPINLISITKPIFVDQIISWVQGILNVKLKPIVSIEAHRQIIGQKVEVHNDYDYNSNGYPNIRLVWNLNGRDRLKSGGNFCFCLKSGQIIKRFPIVRNSAVLFKISDRSYHSIDQIKSGLREVIVFSFWTKRKKVSNEEICFLPS